MKNVILFLLFIGQLSINAQTIQPAPDDKAVVYFARPSSLGFAINFMFFDNDKVIGKFNGNKYLRYECEPGEHLFWAKSESRDFVKGNLEGGKIYVIDVRPQMGAVVAGVKLVPINNTIYEMKKIQKLLAKKKSVMFSEEELERLQSKAKMVIERGLKKAAKQEGEIKALSGFSFSPDDLKL